MDTMTEMSTDEMLAAMLTENTGTHMLDSGGAYGRAWQRNAGKIVADFIAAPEVEPYIGNRYGEVNGRRGATGERVIDWVTLDVFHFLRQRVEYDAALDAAFHEFAQSDEHANESWFASLDAWLEDRGARGPWREDSPMTVNTYNGEDALSQTIQYSVFTLPDDDTDEVYVALMIHGGADVRGGYTAPRMFTMGDAYALFDNADFGIVLTEPDTDPALLAQTVAFAEYPVPVGGRRVMLDVRGGTIDSREGDPWDDASLDVFEFEFGETPIVEPGEGDAAYVIASGPAKGWTVHFYPPFPSG